MYSWRPKIGSQIDELFHIIHHGFQEPSFYKVFFLNKINKIYSVLEQLKGYEEGIPFTNNLYTSDAARIENIRKSSNSKVNLTNKNGYILLCKIFTHKFDDHSAGM